MISSTPIVSSPVVSQPTESSGHSVLSPPKTYESEPETRLRSVEIDPPENSSSANDDKGSAFDSADEEPLPEPTLNGASEAGWRIRWNPVYAREV